MLRTEHLAVRNLRPAALRPRHNMVGVPILEIVLRLDALGLAERALVRLLVVDGQGRVLVELPRIQQLLVLLRPGAQDVGVDTRLLLDFIVHQQVLDFLLDSRLGISTSICSRTSTR